MQTNEMGEQAAVELADIDRLIRGGRSVVPTYGAHERVEVMRVEMVAARPGPRVNMWGDEMDQWSVELECDGRSFETDYFMGSGYFGRAPETNEVLSSLRTDCYAGELTFEDFCSYYGYDEDSRSAYGAWEDCAAMRRRIVAWLDADFEMFVCSDEDKWTTDDAGDVEIAAA